MKRKRNNLQWTALPLWMLLLTIAPHTAHADRVAAPDAPNAEPPSATDVEPSPLVDRLLADELTTDAQRRALRISHGRGDQVADPTLAEQATMALQRGDASNAVFADPQVPSLLRAKAALLRGEADVALRLLSEEEAEGEKDDGAASSAQLALLKARALDQLGQLDQAVATLLPWRQKAQREPINDAAELTAAAQALVLLAELQGRPAQDYQVAIAMLAKARSELDRLYWPAYLAEAQLLAAKDNRKEAFAALGEALPLNPRAAQAWSQLGRLFIESYNFDPAGQIVAKLRELDPNDAGPYADALEARLLLQQRDARGALEVIKPAVARLPHQHELLALLAAAHAVAFDEPATRAALDLADQQSANVPAATAQVYATVGEFLSLTRQYDWGRRMLEAAIERRPNASGPRVELGLILMQAGDLTAARDALRRATELDPFNRRASNQLALVDELLQYQTIESEHFTVRFKDGIDRALARDMPAELERIYAEVTGAFEHQPARRTQIDLMPDGHWFGVRITGMPEIWTIAAATGDVIAMTPPRDGPRQRGAYDWANVVRHEFVHTVTLDQTLNRVPHWFTEACAVSQEETGRDYNTARLLASALHNNKLFSLDQINWGFVRPKTPTDRPLAYAQADWMLQFIAARFGHRTIIAMLRRFHDGATDVQAMKELTGLDAQSFMDEFRGWARDQVQQWGLTPTNDERVTALLSRAAQLEGSPPDAWKDTQRELAALLVEMPAQPDLLHLHAARLVEVASATDNAVDIREARQAVVRYAAARPADPWPHQALVALAARGGDLTSALGSLEALDRRENQHGDWSRQLALSYRATGQLQPALAAALRAVRREPYNGTFRELAATLALQSGNVEAAAHQVEALALIEPRIAQHQTRLAAIYHKLGRDADARAAAERARALDPAAPVERFLQQPSESNHTDTEPQSNPRQADL